MSAILLSWKYLTQHKTVWTWPFLRAIGDLWVLERYDIYLDFQNGWSQKVKQRRNSVFISQIWNRKIVEIKSFPGAESLHLSRWSGKRDKSVTWKLFGVRASDGVISIKERQENRGGPGYYQSTISCCEAICVTEGNLGHTLPHIWCWRRPVITRGG